MRRHFARRGNWPPLGLLAGLALAACAPQADPASVGAFRQSVASGNFQAATNIATALAAPAANGRGTELMWSLNAGAAGLHAQDWPRSVNMLDGAEDLMRASEEASFNWGSTYRFGTYDAVMVNAYKAFAMLGRGDRDGARVELNRMEERQARTVQRFQAEIAAANANAEAQRDAEPGRADALRNAQASPEVREQLQALDRWATYQPFVNPTGTYLRGIFLLNSPVPGDAEAARNAFERVAGISRNNPVVAQDLAAARQAANGRRGPPQVWVIFENGQSPLFEQLNFTVPMPVYARGGGVTVRPVTVSMPRMVAQPNAYSGIQVSGTGARATTLPVASIEGVMASEFRTRYNALLAGAVFEAIAKAALISGVNLATSSGGSRNSTGMAVIGLLADIAATAAANVTSSDTRSWVMLPREYQVARVPVPANGTLNLQALGGPTERVTVPTGRSSIILVKAQNPGSPLTIQVHPL
jgi:uncharacterized protein